MARKEHQTITRHVFCWLYLYIITYVRPNLSSSAHLKFPERRESGEGTNLSTSSVRIYTHAAGQRPVVDIISQRIPNQRVYIAATFQGKRGDTSYIDVAWKRLGNSRASGVAIIQAPLSRSYACIRNISSVASLSISPLCFGADCCPPAFVISPRCVYYMYMFLSLWFTGSLPLYALIHCCLYSIYTDLSFYRSWLK